MDRGGVDLKLRSTWMYLVWSKLMTWFGDIMLRFNQPMVKAADIRKLMFHASKGDVLLRRFDCYADGLVIPGKYSHSGFLVGSDCVKHMMAEGDLVDDVIDFVKDADGFALLRPKYGCVGNRDNAVTCALRTHGKYDFLFDLVELEDADNGRLVKGLKDQGKHFYCHEFTAYCLERGRIHIYTGQDYLTADDFMKVCEVVLEV